MEKTSKFGVKSTEISLRKAFDRKTLILLGIAAIALLVYLYLGGVSIITMIGIMLSANPLILFLGTIFTFIAILIDTLAWKVLLGIASIHPSTSSIYRIQLASFSYGLLIPSAGAVEMIMRIALGTQEFNNELENRKASSGEILSSVIAHKLCGLLAFIPISVFVAFAILAYFNEIIENITGQSISEEIAIIFAISISLLSLTVVIFFILIAKSPKAAKTVTKYILKVFMPVPLIGTMAKNAVDPSEKIIDDFSTQFAYLAEKKLSSLVALVLAFFSQIAHWMSIYFILISLSGITITLDQVAAVNFLGGTIDFLPVGIPGMAGLKEITLSVFLDIGLGLGSTLAASGAILVQLMKFYFIIVVGVLVYIAGKTKVASHELDEKSFSD
ncbi:MAG: flippase-like domain-containing protein [Candidatus Heimdallarchaeota archaeon]|nr:MAG: flippase-like domain-containing protein [Candidatus Heimdallarchaeota archaeon]